MYYVTNNTTKKEANGMTTKRLRVRSVLTVDETIDRVRAREDYFKEERAKELALELYREECMLGGNFMKNVVDRYNEYVRNDAGFNY